MKKIITVAIVLFAVLCANAQEPVTAAQKRTAATKVYELFAKYSELSSLKELGGVITDSSLSRFANLFTPDAKIHDDLNDADATDYQLTTADKSLEDYLKDNKENYPKGLSSKVTKASISFKGLAQKEVKIIYERSANASTVTPPSKIYKSQDTLLMTIKIGEGYNSAKISSIALVSGHLSGPPSTPKCKDDNDCDGVTNSLDKCPDIKGIATNGGCPFNICPNDDDCDGVLNAADKCPKEKGTLDNSGCAKALAQAKPQCANDNDCDGVLNFADKCPKAKGPESNGGCPDVAAIGFALSLNLGFGGNVNSTGDADLSSLGYEKSRATFGSSTKLSNKVGAGINVGVEFDVLFGKQQNMGVSTGLMLNMNFAQAKSEKFQVEYKQTESDGSAYKRILTVNKFDEKLSFTNVGIPVLFKYRTATSETKKIGFSAELGPVISVLATVKSKIDANMDFEAVFSTDKHKLGYPDVNSTSDWLLTKDHVTKHGGGSEAALPAYFDKRYENGYYVGLNHSVSASGGTVKYKLGFGGMLRLGMTYQITESLFFNARIYTTIISNSISNSSGVNKPVEAMDKFKDAGSVTLNSNLNSTSKLLSTQFGINFGIQYKFK